MIAVHVGYRILALDRGRVHLWVVSRYKKKVPIHRLRIFDAGKFPPRSGTLDIVRPQTVEFVPNVIRHRGSAIGVIPEVGELSEGEGSQAKFDHSKFTFQESQHRSH